MEWSNAALVPTCSCLGRYRFRERNNDRCRFRAAKALAALEGRDHVLPDDVQTLAPSVLAHRLLLSYEVDGDQREAVIREAIDRVPAL